MKLDISADSVIRRFVISHPESTLKDWMDAHHDAILEALLNEPNAREVFSGHAGFTVCIWDDDRSDAEIIQSLQARLLDFYQL